jgi:hypothetical protein
MLHRRRSTGVFFMIIFAFTIDLEVDFDDHAVSMKLEITNYLYIVSVTNWANCMRQIIAYFIPTSKPCHNIVVTGKNTNFSYKFEHL